MSEESVLIFATIGFVWILWLITDIFWELMLGLKAHVIPLLKSRHPDLVSKYGSWAVVTGSTDGIGRSYAKELARRGLNVVLISRTLGKLQKVASEIEAEYEVKTKIVVADFSKGQSIYEHIERELKDIQVGILVNNVGVNTPYPMYVTEIPQQSLWDLLNVNIGATTMMTRIILPQMQKRQKGAIVNVSSGSELQPLPLMSVYAATKIFIKNFTEALRYEYQKDGITVQQLSPLFVNTKMNAFSYRLQKTSLFVPDADMYARNAVNTLGVVEHSTGYWSHGFQYFFISVPPVWIRTLIGGIMNQAFRKDYFNGEKRIVVTGGENDRHLIDVRS